MAWTCGHLGQHHLQPVPTPPTQQPRNHPVSNLHNLFSLIPSSLGSFRAILSGWEGSRAPLQKQPPQLYLLAAAEGCTALTNPGFSITRHLSRASKRAEDGLDLKRGLLCESGGIHHN